jgi:hypothetical protein
LRPFDTSVNPLRGTTTHEDSGRTASLFVSRRDCNLPPPDSLLVSGESDWAGHRSRAKEIRHDKNHEDNTGAVCGAVRRGHRGTGGLKKRPWRHHGDPHSVKRCVGEPAGQRDWRAQRREHGIHHQPQSGDVLRRLRDDIGRHVDCHRSADTHARSWRAGRIHYACGSDDPLLSFPSRSTIS